MGKVLAVVAAVLGVLVFVVWLCGSSNPETSAGYVGYLTQGAVFGKTTFYGLQTGPTSPGRTWLLHATNVSVTPYTYNEPFTGTSSVLSKDNLKIEFSVHIVWKIRADRVKDFVENYSTLNDETKPDVIVQTAYNNFLKERLRTFARDEIQKLDALKIKEEITPAGAIISKRVLELTKDTPFEVTNVVVGNIQYPGEVADAVAKKMATTQLLEQKGTEIQIASKDAEKRVKEAKGIAEAMDVITSKLSPQYLQHEAIEAQKAMVNSPNHTTIYIPVGNNGVPLVGTFDVSAKHSAKGAPTQPSK